MKRAVASTSRRRVATARSASTGSDRCELCSARIGPSARDRIGHLRAAHRAYATGLLLRVFAPGVLVLLVLVLSAAHAPPWAFVVALFAAFGLLFAGRVRSRAERRRAGTRPTLPLGKLLREGGVWFVLIVPVIAALMLLLGR